MEMGVKYGGFNMQVLLSWQKLVDYTLILLLVADLLLNRLGFKITSVPFNMYGEGSFVRVVFYGIHLFPLPCFTSVIHCISF
jgi:hypothetical protein